MARPPDTLVEIPPPETAPVATTWWALVLVSMAAVAGIVLVASATEPRVPAFDWMRHRGPDSVSLDTLVAAGDGFAMLSGMTPDGVLLWHTSDGMSWQAEPLTGAPRQLATIGDRLLAYSVLHGHFVDPTPDGWVESPVEIGFPDEIRARQSSGRPSMVTAGDGFLAMSLFGDVWWTEDGSDFEDVVTDPDWGPGVEQPFDSGCRPPSRTSPDVPPIAETTKGLVALVSSNPAEPFGIWPVCEPRSWLSDDGRTWTETGADLGDGAFVYDIAAREGVVIAVGGHGIGEPAVWISSDGVDWSEVPTFSDLEGLDIFTVDAGPSGWVVLARQADSPDTTGWTSVDGVCWETVPSEVDGLDASVSAGSLMVVDRTSYPELWSATPTGGKGSCR